jgi:hypothetical protein
MKTFEEFVPGNEFATLDRCDRFEELLFLLGR